MYDTFAYYSVRVLILVKTNYTYPFESNLAEKNLEQTTSNKLQPIEFLRSNLGLAFSFFLSGQLL
jgi:hypothetical protein